MKHRSNTFIDLLATMTLREIQTEYKNTFFGVLWLVGNPLLQMVVIGFVFNLLIKNDFDNYYLFLFPNLVLWQFFSGVVSKGTRSIVNERSLVKKARFSRIIIPLSYALSGLFHAFVALSLAWVAATVIYGFTIRYFLALLSVIIAFFFATGLSLLTSATHVKYRDVAFGVQAIMQVLFYLTPVIYSLSLIPDRYIGFWMLNPLTYMFQLMHVAFMNVGSVSVYTIGTGVFIAAVVFVVGVLYFNTRSDEFDDWL